MQKMSKEMRSLLTRVAALGVVLGVYSTNNKLAMMFSMLPVDMAPPPSAATDEQKSKTLASLYPLLVTTDGAQQAGRIDPRRLDASFLPPEEKPHPVMVRRQLPPDYFLYLPQVLVVDAIADNGAVISGWFYTLNEPITDYAYPGKRGTEVPRISAVGRDRIEITAGNRHMTLHLAPS